MTYGSDVEKPPSEFDENGNIVDENGSRVLIFKPEWLMTDEANLTGMSQVIYLNFKAEVIKACDKAEKDINKIEMDEPMKTNLIKVSKAGIIYDKKHTSFCIAKGVVEYVKSNMEVYGIKAKIDSPTATVAAGIPLVASGYPGATTGPGTATINNPVVSQTNGGTGLVK
jgi:hypothetical protein